MIETIRAGQRYIQTLPNRKKLQFFLPHYRLIRLTQFATKAMPAFACFALCWQYFFPTPEQTTLASAVLTALFALSIPIQSLFILGVKAKAPLSLPLLDWYEELRKQLLEKHPDLTVQAMPTHQDLANLLALADQTLGDGYFDDL